MKNRNKEMLLYSMNKAYEELKCAMIEYNTNEKEVYFRLGSCLHWIMDCYERVKEIVPEEQKILFLSLAAANNAQKHLKEFEKMSVITGNGYPKQYPKRYGVKYTWKSLEEVPLNSRTEKKLYQEKLLGRNIMKTLTEAKRQIEDYFERE